MKPTPEQVDELSDLIAGLAAVKPRIIEALEARDDRTIPCPTCGKPTKRYGGGRIGGRWHTSFHCDCGFAYRE